jgi:hypothetical protein
MGFTVEKASQALIQTDNKIGAALDWYVKLLWRFSVDNVNANS